MFELEKIAPTATQEKNPFLWGKPSPFRMQLQARTSLEGVKPQI